MNEEWKESLRKDFEARYPKELQTPEKWEWYKKSNLGCIKRLIKDIKRFKKGIKFISEKKGVYHLHANGNWRVPCHIIVGKYASCPVCKAVQEI